MATQEENLKRYAKLFSPNRRLSAPEPPGLTGDNEGEERRYYLNNAASRWIRKQFGLPSGLSPTASPPSRIGHHTMPPVQELSLPSSMAAPAAAAPLLGVPREFIPPPEITPGPFATPPSGFPPAMRQFGSGPAVPESFTPPPQAARVLPESVPGSGRTMPQAVAALLADRDAMASDQPPALPVPLGPVNAATAQASPGQAAFAHNAALAAGGPSGYNPALAGAIGRHGLSSRTLPSGFTQPLDPNRPALPDLGPRAASVQKEIDEDEAHAARMRARRQIDPEIQGSEPVRLLSNPQTPEDRQKRAEQIQDYTKRLKMAGQRLDLAAKAEDSADYEDLLDAALRIHPGPMGRDSPLSNIRREEAADVSRQRFSARRARLGQPLGQEERAEAAASEGLARQQAVQDRAIGITPFEKIMRDATPEQQQQMMEQRLFGQDNAARFGLARIEAEGLQAGRDQERELGLVNIRAQLLQEEMANPSTTEVRRAEIPEELNDLLGGATGRGTDGLLPPPAGIPRAAGPGLGAGGLEPLPNLTPTQRGRQKFLDDLAKEHTTRRRFVAAAIAGGLSEEEAEEEANLRFPASKPFGPRLDAAIGGLFRGPSHGVPGPLQGTPFFKRP